MLNNAVKNNLIEKTNAEKIVPALICAGPSFVISFVGEQIFGNIALGIYLYISQIFSNVIIFLILKKRNITIKKTENFSVINTLPAAVKNSAESVITVCTYIVLFLALKPIIVKIFGSKIAEYIIYFSEVSSGVLMSKNIYITCGILAFGGMCVMLQIISFASTLNLSILRIIKWRIIAVILSLLTFKALLILKPVDISVFSNLTTEPKINFGGSAGFITTAVFSVFVMLISLSKKTNGKILEDII